MTDVTPSRGLRRWGERWLPPLLAFVAAKLVLWAVATGGGVQLATERAWRHGDQGHYLAIAKEGYHLIECHKIGYVPDGWCGTAGWFPGYPMLIRGLTAVGVPAEVAAVALSNLFHLLSLVILWLGFLVRPKADDAASPTRDATSSDRVGVRAPSDSPSQRWLLLGVAAFFPGQIFYQSAFPLSLFICAVLTSLWCLERGRFLLAGLAAAVAAYSYSTGFLLVPVLGLAILLHHRGPSWAETLRRLALVAGVAALGFAAVLLTHHLALGKWSAFFMVQAKYGHGLHEPLGTLLTAMKGLFGAPPSYPALQTALVAGLVLVLVVSSPWRLERERARDHTLRIYGLAFWLFPLIMGSGVSLFRAEALLLPLVPVMARLRAPVLVVLLAVFLLLAGAMTLLFFANRLL